MSSIFQMIQQVQTRYQEVLLTKRNVVGVAMGYKKVVGGDTAEPAVVVLVEQKQPLAALDVQDRVPKEIDGVVTDVMEAGYLQALSEPGPRSRFRPTIPGGVSIGHYKVTAGTLGVMVHDRTTGQRLILSNNHVLANSNEAMKGDAILQPAAMDGGQNPADVVAKLERFVPLVYQEGDVQPPAPPDAPDETPIPTPRPSPGGSGGSGCDVVDAFVAIGNMFAQISGSQKRVTATAAAQDAAGAAASTATTGATALSSKDNLVDAALARPLDPGIFLDPIRSIGTITGTMPAALGQRVRKSGRTTDYTESTVALLNATVNVNYNTSRGKRTARFTNQVICDPFSEGGDSGSLIVDLNSANAVGLLFAGSPLATIFTPIDAVLNALDVRF